MPRTEDVAVGQDRYPFPAPKSMFEDFDTEVFDQAVEEAEQSTAHLSKLTAQTMFREIEAITNELRPLCDAPEINWPRISVLCASLRGYAFNAFRITHWFAARELRQHSGDSHVQPRSASLTSVTLDDLL